MDDMTFARPVVGAQPSSRRFTIMGMLFVTVVINYLDRANLSIAAPGITAEFHLTPVQLGMVFSAFGWFYTGMQLPGRLAGRSHSSRHPLSGNNLSVVARHGVDGAREQPGRPDRAPCRRGLHRGAELPDEQPDRHHMVRRTGARDLRRRLQLCDVCRIGVPDTAFDMASGRVWLADGLSVHRRIRHRMGLCVCPMCAASRPGCEE